MYEFTWGGLSLRWSALDRRGKWLFVIVSLLAVAAVVPLAPAMSAWLAGGLQRLGLAVPVRPVPPFTPGMAAWTIGCGAAASVLWWRFSRTQDEMFNRIQNWALGNAAIWTMHLCLVWTVLATAGLVPAASGPGLLALLYVVFLGFWLVAVKRWA